MHITFVIPFAGFAGGIRVVAIYAQHLQARGHIVTVVSTARRSPPRWRDKVQYALGLRSPPPPPRLAPWFDALGERHIRLDTPGPVRAEDVPDGDLVIATWWQTAEWVAGLPAEKGRKAYLLQDCEALDHSPSDRVASTYMLDLTKVAVSNYIRRTIRDRFAVQDEIIVVPNAVDTDQFQAPPRSRNATLTVGFLYSPAPRKNIRLALASLDQARAICPGLRVLAFGPAPDPTVPLPDWVEYHDFPAQDRIAQLYAACDLWLFPSEREGFGLPILEAMACRTPVLATRAGGAPDLIDGANGLLLPDDPAAFAAAIRQFYEMPAEAWTEWSDAAYQTAARNDWNTATDRLLAALQGAED